MNGFAERNPNLKVFNAIMHLDEETPHLHIDYVPFSGNEVLTRRDSKPLIKLMTSV